MSRLVADHRGKVAGYLCGGERLMRFNIEVLQGMGKRVMADVVQQAGAEERFHTGDRDWRIGALARQARDHPPGNVENAKAVAAPRVRGAGIDEVGGPELPDAVQLLELRVLRHLQKGPRQRDVLPHRVPDRLGVVIVEMIEDFLPFSHDMLR